MSQPRSAAGPLHWPMTLDCQVRADPFMRGGRGTHTHLLVCCSFVLHESCPLLLNPPATKPTEPPPPPPPSTKKQGPLAQVM